MLRGQLRSNLSKQRFVYFVKNEEQEQLHGEPVRVEYHLPETSAVRMTINSNAQCTSVHWWFFSELFDQCHEKKLDLWSLKYAKVYFIVIAMFPICHLLRDICTPPCWPIQLAKVNCMYASRKWTHDFLYLMAIVTLSTFMRYSVKCWQLE